ncbi:hypothetical protein ACVD1N_05915 [Vibrio parahaemolyticus]
MKLVDITHYQAHKLYHAELINTRQFMRLAARIRQRDVMPRQDSVILLQNNYDLRSIRPVIV